MVYASCPDRDEDDDLSKPLLVPIELEKPEQLTYQESGLAGCEWAPLQDDSDMWNPGSVKYKISGEMSQEVGYWDEIWSILAIGFPVGASSFLRVLMAITDISVLGRLNQGTEYLAAAGLATVIMDVTSTFPSTAADSLNALCSQALGANNPKLAGRWLKIGLIIATLMCIPVMLSWTLVDRILLSFGMPKDISQLARTFALWSTIGLIPNTVYYAIRQYFQSLKVVYPALFNNLIFIFLNFVLNMVFVHGVGSWNGLGFIGSPIATSVSRSLQLLAFVSYTCFYLRLHAATWPDTPFWCCFTRANLSKYWNQTFPTIIGNATTQWLMQVVTLLASRIGVVEVASQSAVYSIVYAFQCLNIGVAKAGTCRIGYFLGASEPKNARKSAGISVSLSLSLGAVIAMALVWLHNDYGRCFSNDPKVWKCTSDLIPFVAVSFVGLSSVTILSAILYGQGRPQLVAITSACTSWLLSLPLACIFAFVCRLGLPGLWIGLACGQFALSFILGTWILKSNWEQRAWEAIWRSSKCHVEEAQ